MRSSITETRRCSGLLLLGNVDQGEEKTIKIRSIPIEGAEGGNTGAGKRIGA